MNCNFEATGHLRHLLDKASPHHQT